ncbi:hypothetical protein [Bradyrhizobium sp. URHD0069]|uniref:hypothetical protein n=1 Tax=Bradyrhizobium sp. URHD0069 TaxID=1380355 RepID=UPI000495AC76|nr:hypothetical protein [Bradyrhizobium sp. URHD0069]
MTTSTLETRNVNLARLSAILGDGHELRIAADMHCPSCGAVVRNYPEPLDDGFRLLCDGCHRDIIVFEPAS